MLRRSIVAGVSLLAISATAQAQLIDMGDYRAPKMHASASSSMLILTSIVDGVTASTWDFAPLNSIARRWTSRLEMRRASAW